MASMTEARIFIRKSISKVILSTCNLWECFVFCRRGQAEEEMGGGNESSDGPEWGRYAKYEEDFRKAQIELNWYCEFLVKYTFSNCFTQVPYSTINSNKISQDPAIKKKEDEKQHKPHIYNLNSDNQLTGKIVHILKSGETTVGNRKGTESDIVMTGPRYVMLLYMDSYNRTY